METKTEPVKPTDDLSGNARTAVSSKAESRIKNVVIDIESDELTYG
jgi:hypothetical protein